MSELDYVELAAKHNALQKMHIALQSEFIALQDKHIALLNATNNKRGELVEALEELSRAVSLCSGTTKRVEAANAQAKKVLERHK